MALTQEQRSDSRAAAKAARELQRSRLASLLFRQTLYEESAKLKDCGSPSAIICTGCGHEHPIVRTCKRRWCPVCAHQRAAELVAKYGLIIERLGWPLMLTLTLPHTRECDPAERLDSLKIALKKFRRQKWFKDRVAGGIGAIEVSGGLANGWHIHAHLLLDCQWLSVTTPAPSDFVSSSVRKKIMRASQKEVADQWALSAGLDSAHIWIKRADASAVVEALKYSVKPASLIDSKLHLGPLIAALSKRRLVSAWGSVRKAARALKLELDAENGPFTCECGDSSWIPSELVDRMCRIAGENARPIVSMADMLANALDSSD